MIFLFFNLSDFEFQRELLDDLIQEYNSTENYLSLYQNNMEIMAQDVKIWQNLTLELKNHTCESIIQLKLDMLLKASKKLNCNLDKYHYVIFPEITLDSKNYLEGKTKLLNSKVLEYRIKVFNRDKNSKFFAYIQNETLLFKEYPNPSKEELDFIFMVNLNEGIFEKNVSCLLERYLNRYSYFECLDNFLVVKLSHDLKTLNKQLKHKLFLQKKLKKPLLEHIQQHFRSQNYFYYLTNCHGDSAPELLRIEFREYVNEFPKNWFYPSSLGDLDLTKMNVDTFKLFIQRYSNSIPSLSDALRTNTWSGIKKFLKNSLLVFNITHLNEEIIETLQNLTHADFLEYHYFECWFNEEITCF